MKKSVILISFAVLTFIISSIGFVSAASNKANKKVFYGRVIFIADNYIELKKGKTEIKINLTEKSKYFSRDGKETGKSSIAVCQYVDAHYSEQAGKKYLDKIVVKKDSDCAK